MSGKAIGLRLNNGYPGSVSRAVDNIISNRIVDPDDLVGIAFGKAAVLNTDNSYSAFGASNVSADFAGIAVREVKQTTDYYTAAGEYLPSERCDVLERGSTTVICTEGTPTAGGKVYICTVAGTTAAVGDFLATASPAGQGATAVEMTTMKWTTGYKDANNVAEVTILSRQN